METKLPIKIKTIFIAHRMKINLVLAGLIIAILIIFIIYPLWQQIPKNNEKLAELQNKEQLLKNKLSTLHTYIGLPREIKLAIKKIQDMQVDPNFPVDLLEFLDALARENNLTVNYAPATQVKSKKEIAYRISLTGSFQDTLRFINKLENGSFLVFLDKIQIQKNIEDKTLATEITIKVLTK